MLIVGTKEMLEFGQELAKKHKILMLNGELGAGKTMLTKGFAKGLGINFSIVNSPTYAYINIYDNKLLHIDMYRIEKFDELIEKGIIDLIQEHEYIAIERPKFKEKLGLKNYVEINIQKISDKKREIEIKN